jgi:hypothetical protein
LTGSFAGTGDPLQPLTFRHRQRPHEHFRASAHPASPPTNSERNSLPDTRSEPTDYTANVQRRGTRSQFRMLPTSMRQDLLSGLTELFSDEVPLVIHTTLLLARRRQS